MNISAINGVKATNFSKNTSINNTKTKKKLNNHMNITQIFFITTIV